MGWTPDVIYSVRFAVGGIPTTHRPASPTSPALSPSSVRGSVGVLFLGLLSRHSDFASLARWVNCNLRTTFGKIVRRTGVDESGALVAHFPKQQVPANNCTDMKATPVNDDGEADSASPYGSLQQSAHLSSGGAGNRTPVPWHFHAGIYVCSLSTLGVHLTATSRSLDRVPTGGIPGQLSARFFSGNRRRGGSGGVPDPQVPASPTCVRTGPFRAKLPGRPAGYYAARENCGSAVKF